MLDFLNAYIFWSIIDRNIIFWHELEKDIKILHSNFESPSCFTTGDRVDHLWTNLCIGWVKIAHKLVQRWFAGSHEFLWIF